MGSGGSSLAPQLSLDLCVARAELEFESLSIAVAGARLRRFYRSSSGGNRSRLDGFYCRHYFQCGRVLLRNRNGETARSDWRGVAEARVFVTTIQAHDELDSRHHEAHH